MDDKKKSKPLFWPMVFMLAFLLGAILWGLWMAKVIRQTRINRENGFFVPMSNPATNDAAPASTNAPAARTNSI